jgi:hypothetical protein
MAFNARWAFEELAAGLNQSVPALLGQFLRDFADLVSISPVFSLAVAPNGNCFRIFDRSGCEQRPDSVAGLYAVFSTDMVVYFGEASDLCRRQLTDPDNTADSGKIFTNQGRAVLKFLLHHGWAAGVGLSPLFIQLYPATALVERQGRTFEECYQVSKFSKALEGALSLHVQRYHSAMLARAIRDGLMAAG